MADGRGPDASAGMRTAQRMDCRRGQRLRRQPGMDTGMDSVQSAHSAANRAAGSAADARPAQIVFQQRPRV